MKPPIEIDQNWKSKWTPKGMQSYPVVFARQTLYDKKIPTKREVWIEWIKKGWMHVSTHLREWLDENGYKNVKPEQ